MNNPIIRQYKKEDIPGFYEAAMESVDEVSQWLPWCDENYTIEDTHYWINEIVPERWATGSGCEFVIVDAETDIILGGCSLEQIDLTRKEANIGYWVRTSATGNGLATKACHFLINYGFDKLNLETIKVIASVENKGSKRVGEKLPYASSDFVKNGFQIRYSISDAVVYRITRQSYKG